MKKKNSEYPDEYKLVGILLLTRMKDTHEETTIPQQQSYAVIYCNVIK